MSDLDYDSGGLNNLDSLSNMVNESQSDLDDALEALEAGSFDVTLMLEAQVAMNSFSQAVETNTQMISAMHSAIQSVNRNLKG